MEKPKRLVLRRQLVRVLTDSEVKQVGGGMCNTVTATGGQPCCDSKTQLLNPFTH